MTTPDEMKRAVDRLLAAPIGTNALSYDFLLSERAELLAAVERMRGAALALYMAGHWSCDRPADEAALWTALRDALDLAPGTATRAALTTGEATTPNAGEKG